MELWRAIGSWTGIHTFHGGCQRCQPPLTYKVDDRQFELREDSREGCNIRFRIVARTIGLPDRESGRRPFVIQLCTLLYATSTPVFTMAFMPLTFVIKRFARSSWASHILPRLTRGRLRPLVPSAQLRPGIRPLPLPLSSLPLLCLSLTPLPPCQIISN